MAETLKILKKRLRSIRNTEHITHAMEMVAANKLRRTETLLKGMRPYLKKVEELLGYIVKDGIYSSSAPLLLPIKDKSPALFIVLTSDRGLCGAFNSHIMSFAIQEIKKKVSDKEEVALYLVGSKAKLLPPLFPNAKILGEKVDMNGRASLGDVKEILNNIKELYLTKKVSSVHVISYAFGNHSKGHTEIQTLLPLTPPAKSGENQNKEHHLNLDFIFEPSLDTACQLICEDYVYSKLYTVLLEQFMCEHRFRMLSMNNATKSCQKLNEILTLKSNKARQASITKELLDIVGGAEAMN